MHEHEVGWTVTITVEDESLPPFPDERSLDLLEAFDSWGGAITGRTTHAGYGATFSYRTDATDPLRVLTEGLALFRRVATDVGLPELPVAECELMTFAFHDRWLDS